MICHQRLFTVGDEPAWIIQLAGAESVHRILRDLLSEPRIRISGRKLLDVFHAWFRGLLTRNGIERCGFEELVRTLRSRLLLCYPRSEFLFGKAFRFRLLPD